jgi:hypothetical protein
LFNKLYDKGARIQSDSTLYYAVENPKAANWLLDHGANISSLSEYYDLPLMLKSSVKEGNIELLQKMVAAKVRFTGGPALQALEPANEEIFKFVKENFPEVPIKFEKHVLQENQPKQNKGALAQELFDEINGEMDPEKISRLIESGVDINADVFKSRGIGDALSYFIEKSNVDNPNFDKASSEILKAAKDLSEKQCHQLLYLSFEKVPIAHKILDSEYVNITDLSIVDQKRAPIKEVVWQKITDLSLFDKLFAKGAKVERGDEESTALSLSLYNLKTANWLIDHGADISKVEPVSLHRLLENAVAEEDIGLIKKLIGAKAQIIVENPEWPVKTPNQEIFNLIKENYPDMPITLQGQHWQAVGTYNSYEQNTKLLIEAVNNKDIKAVLELLQVGADTSSIQNWHNLTEGVNKSNAIDVTTILERVRYVNSEASLASEKVVDTVIKEKLLEFTDVKNFIEATSSSDFSKLFNHIMKDSAVLDDDLLNLFQSLEYGSQATIKAKFTVLEECLNRSLFTQEQIFAMAKDELLKGDPLSIQEFNRILRDDWSPVINLLDKSDVIKAYNNILLQPESTRESNINKFMQQVNWNERIGPNNNSLLMELASSTSYSFVVNAVVEKIVKQRDSQGLPIAQLNLTNSEGKRLIDIYRDTLDLNNTSPAMVFLLRKQGSREPKSPLINPMTTPIDADSIHSTRNSTVIIARQSCLHKKYNLQEHEVDPVFTEMEQFAQENMEDIAPVALERLKALKGMTEIKVENSITWKFFGELALLYKEAKAQGTEKQLIKTLAGLPMQSCGVGYLTNLYKSVEKLDQQQEPVDLYQYSGEEIPNRAVEILESQDYSAEMIDKIAYKFCEDIGPRSNFENVSIEAEVMFKALKQAAEEYAMKELLNSRPLSGIEYDQMWEIASFIAGETKTGEKHRMANAYEKQKLKIQQEPEVKKAPTAEKKELNKVDGTSDKPQKILSQTNQDPEKKTFTELVEQRRATQPQNELGK